ncbi:hypothetical protein AB835_04580 [Candidatus Endobugula sertula]|uniref:Pilus assembly protein PilP n=1 Tax=Candidatus Endobugula sertula TaxID=62101 RepID=A0A1D2QRT2_9GAMM|nr:hypothetical protein AB835_04580 [Candidatus Endobugula sertula]
MSLQDTLEQLNNLDLNDIDWSRMGGWPLLGRLCVWGLAMVGVLGVTYFLFVQGLQDTLHREVRNESQLRQAFQQKVFQAAALDQYRTQMGQMKQDFKFLLAQLPKKTQVPGLLDDIDEKGSISGLNILSIKLKSEIVGEFYVILPIEISAEGSYHNIGSFVSGIAGMSRIVTLHDFNITAGSHPSKLKVVIQAKTYRSIDEGSS